MMKKSQNFLHSTNNRKYAAVKHEVARCCHVNPNVKLESNKNDCLDLTTQILR